MNWFLNSSGGGVGEAIFAVDILPMYQKNPLVYKPSNETFTKEEQYEQST